MPDVLFVLGAGAGFFVAMYQWVTMIAETLATRRARSPAPARDNPLSRCPGQPRTAVRGHRPVAHVRQQRGTEQEPLRRSTQPGSATCLSLLFSFFA